MKSVCSFLPAVTQMIYDLDLQDHLHGVTFECPKEALNEKQKVVRCVLEGKDLDSAEIDKVYSASKAEGKSLYYVDEQALKQIQPDIIFTQDVCEVCQIDTKCTAEALSILDKQPRLLPYSPVRFEDALSGLVEIATAIGHEEKAYTYLAEVKATLAHITDKLRKGGATPKRVMLMEWTEPIYNCGHWIPDQIAYAGGIDMLSNPGGDSIRIPWEKVTKYNPEVLVIAPCGFETSRALRDMKILTAKPGWNELKAVEEKAVFLADYDLFTQPSVSTLLSGVQVLAALFHPEIFDIPEKLKSKVLDFTSTSVQKTSAQYAPKS